jgi:hypothetical protein
MIRATLEYIHANPVRRGIVDRIEDYPYSSASGKWETDAGIYFA